MLGFQLDLAASAPAREGGPPSCRRCAAPLAVAPGAFSSTCGYCGADSVVSELPPVALSVQRYHSAIRTLKEAAAALERRRLFLALGVAGLAALVGGASALLGLALRVTL